MNKPNAANNTSLNLKFHITLKILENGSVVALSILSLLGGRGRDVRSEAARSRGTLNIRNTLHL